MTTRAAIYLRISLDAAMDGLAIDRQRQDCEALAEQRGWDVVHTYVDQSISASKKDVDRPDESVPYFDCDRQRQNATKHQHPRRPEVDRRAFGNEFAGH
ncbi:MULTISPECIES: recombinase family protein [Corynebacterium]|uniref:recombinase family protein n=1 Tax=Corynebacterium TaxID=1716 RepID=UPI0008A520D8|nr:MULTISPECIES: recombinase family protein [Corynebacterium]MDK6493501.1 recombinase family protein [Corynebacterium coyleae]MDK8242369.1 recombinase family protein [Corynebacterium coyleae]MDK8664425.1 recombinase family protein [Corynebacterium coyleae]MDK8707426.1 recombinase family protein [Corynebacterium coyleae]MDK8734274.1 recombinase family protein [Corynebacterium coyleae]